MSARAREVELLLLTAFAAVPLYFSGAIGVPALVLFHGALALMTWRVARGQRAAIVPEAVMRGLAIAYVPFYVIDAAVISRSAIAASTHLVLFIAVYQPMESMQRENRAQRLLTTTLIFIAAIATSTEISITIFVIVFTFVMFRQLMYTSHLETERAVGAEYGDVPSSRAAAFYLAGTLMFGVILFPILPRVRNPLLHGVTGALTNASTGLSNSIDFNESRTSVPDPSVAARVWMGQEAIPFFTPLRLRGTVYDRYQRNQWLQTHRGYRPIATGEGTARIARPVGFTRRARLQQRLSQRNPRVFIPVGTYAVSGLPALAEGPGRGAYVSYMLTRDVVTYEVAMALQVEPLRPERPVPVAYPVIPEVAAMARQIVGNETAPAAQAAAVEHYLLVNFRYLAKPEQIGRTMTTDEFLLRDKRGHCEYFAAGMVALMTALNVPARIVGGFYGGRLNPLTGYFVVRHEDAHAWVEVWDGQKWMTFDPTPPSLRPGNTQDGLLRTYASAISDSVTYYWDRYILTYGLGDQIAFMTAIIGSLRDLLPRLRVGVSVAIFRNWQLKLVVLGALVMLVSLAAAELRRRRRTLFSILADHLATHGIQVGASMTMEEALATLSAQHPDAARELLPVIQMYEAEQFSAERDARRVTAIKRKLTELRSQT